MSVKATASVDLHGMRVEVARIEATSDIEIAKLAAANPGLRFEMVTRSTFSVTRAPGFRVTPGDDPLVTFLADQAGGEQPAVRYSLVPVRPWTLHRCHQATAAVTRGDWLADHLRPDPPIPWRDLDGWAAVLHAVRVWWLWAAGEAA